LVQALAIDRPGAAAHGWKEVYVRRRRGAEPPAYAHPSLESVLKASLGVILYDEDQTGVIEVLTGLAAGEADRLRRQLSDPDRTGEVSGIFLGLCERNQVSRQAADLVLGQLARFKDYAIAKSHAVSFAAIAWQECRLKVRAPVACWTSVHNNHGGAYPRRVHVEAAKRDGV